MRNTPGENVRPGFNPYEAPRAVLGPADDAEPLTSVTFRLTAEDTKALQGAIHLDWAAKLGAWSLGVLFSISVIVGGICLFELILDPMRSHRAAELVPVSVLMAWLVGLPTFLVLKIRFWRGRDESDPRGDTTVKLTPEALLVRYPVGVSTRVWAGIVEVKEHKGAILFLLNDFDPVGRRFVVKNAYIVPHRAFATPGQAKDFFRAAQHWHAAAPR